MSRNDACRMSLESAIGTHVVLPESTILLLWTSEALRCTVLKNRSECLARRPKLPNFLLQSFVFRGTAIRATIGISVLSSLNPPN